MCAGDSIYTHTNSFLGGGETNNKGSILEPFCCTNRCYSTITQPNPVVRRRFTRKLIENKYHLKAIFCSMMYSVNGLGVGLIRTFTKAGLPQEKARSKAGIS